MDINLFTKNETIYNINFCDDIPSNISCKPIKESIFDINFYKLFNDDLIGLSNDELINHYNFYGKIENRIISESDFYNKYPEFNLDEYKKYNKKIKNLPDYEVMHYYTKYKRNNNYENKSEKIYYENMDVKYIVDHLLQNNIKILVVNGDYDESSGGISIMHYFCHLINYISRTNIAYLIDVKDKYIDYYDEEDFKLITNKNYITPLATKDILLTRNNIVIYSDCIKGNPLEQKYAVRWVLFFELGSKMQYWGENDLILWYTDIYRKYNHQFQEFNKDVLHKKLTNNQSIFSLLSNIPKLMDISGNNLNNKDECCFTIRKLSKFMPNRGRSIYKHDLENNYACNYCINVKWPAECNCIDTLDGIKLKHNYKYNKVYRFEYPVLISEEIELFKKTGTFYCYDPFCFSAVIASLCNCLTVTPRIELFNDNKLYENVPWVQYGISYGDDEESINNALNTLPFSRILLRNLFFNINYDNMKIFFESIYTHFFTKNFSLGIPESIKAKKVKILIYDNYNGVEIKSLLETNNIFKNNFEIIFSNNNLEVELKDTYILIYDYQNILENIPDYVKKLSVLSINFNDLLKISIDNLNFIEHNNNIKLANYLLETNKENYSKKTFLLYIVNKILQLLDINLEFN
jgi:hypothetical protein